LILNYKINNIEFTIMIEIKNETKNAFKKIINKNDLEFEIIR